MNSRSSDLLALDRTPLPIMEDITRIPAPESERPPRGALSQDRGRHDLVEPPRGKLYGVIYADPPWRYNDATPNRAIENHYPTMSDEEIWAIQVPAAKDAVLYLWVTVPKLCEGLRTMTAWGFGYKSHAVWDKVRLGMGYWFRGQHELLMVARGAGCGIRLPRCTFRR